MINSRNRVQKLAITATFSQFENDGYLQTFIELAFNFRFWSLGHSGSVRLIFVLKSTKNVELHQLDDKFLHTTNTKYISEPVNSSPWYNPQ
jgi:hypothetical protein